MSKGVGTILVSAFNLINGERQGDYGDPKESFERIARFWSVYLGHEVSGKDVAMMMVLLKMSREMSGHKPDNLLDMAGYVGLADALEANKKAAEKTAKEFAAVFEKGEAKQKPCCKNCKHYSTEAIGECRIPGMLTYCPEQQVCDKYEEADNK